MRPSNSWAASTGANKMKSLVFAIATLACGLIGVSQASAQSVSWTGSYQVTNSSTTTVPVKRTVVTFPAGTLTGATTNVAPSGSQFLNLNLTTSGTVFSNSFAYENLTGTKGCIFTTLGIFNRTTQRYSYTFSKSVINPSGAGPIPTCVWSNSFVNPTTGNFSATATVSGF
jgi:hypothetical protein